MKEDEKKASPRRVSKPCTPPKPLESKTNTPVTPLCSYEDPCGEATAIIQALSGGIVSKGDDN
ncbi:Hypothetical protein FKW44_009179 [Caligus rogercresseyi]|uniref:Uncharacterized protein n=1 Tax=Caligus rogercresseyi TaxID=217165 RepID=A0A7T8K8P5_CALRO|nr:Hypothetical protein FKW44_009179 [Caligus rogercresseyi]